MSPTYEATVGFAREFARLSRGRIVLGRATFRYGTEVKPGERHIVWLRVGGHDILARPSGAGRR